jgi:hypothetical protein
LGKEIPLVLPLGWVIPIEEVREMKQAIDVWSSEEPKRIGND